MNCLGIKHRCEKADLLEMSIEGCCNREARSSRKGCVMSFVLQPGLAILALLALGRPVIYGQQPVQALPANPGEAVQVTVHREGDERYRLSFPASGAAFAEISGIPADCAFQIGSQGFQQSAGVISSAPLNATMPRLVQSILCDFRIPDLPLCAGERRIHFCSIAIRIPCSQGSRGTAPARRFLL